MCLPWRRTGPQRFENFGTGVEDCPLIGGHFDLFNTIRLEYLKDPYPAWTAVEVAGLRREGAIVEIRVIANTDPGS